MTEPRLAQATVKFVDDFGHQVEIFTSDRESGGTGSGAVAASLSHYLSLESRTVETAKIKVNFTSSRRKRNQPNYWWNRWPQARGWYRLGERQYIGNLGKIENGIVAVTA